MDTKYILAERITSALAESGLRQKDLAKILGVTDNTISYFCNGNRSPQIQQLPLIAKALNTTTDYLLGVTNDPAQQPSAVEDLGLSPAVISQINKLKETSTSDCNNLRKANRILNSNDVWDLLLLLHDYYTAAEVDGFSSVLLAARKGNIDKVAKDLEKSAVAYQHSDIDLYDFMNFKAISYKTDILGRLGLESTNLLEFINLRIEQQLHDILRRIKSETTFDTKNRIMMGE